MAKFKKGDWVSAIDEDFEGAVKSVKGESIIVEDVDGFELEFAASELVKVETDDSAVREFTKNSFHNALKEKETERNKKAKKPSVLKTKKQTILKIDLHSSEILETEKGMSAYKILDYQVNTAKRKLEFAMEKKIPKVIIIHGVGEGVLKMEIDTLLRRYDNLEFFDADYKTYGYGATEVRIYQGSSS